MKYSMVFTHKNTYDRSYFVLNTKKRLKVLILSAAENTDCNSFASFQQQLVLNILDRFVNISIDTLCLNSNSETSVKTNKIYDIVFYSDSYKYESVKYLRSHSINATIHYKLLNLTQSQILMINNFSCIHPQFSYKSRKIDSLRVDTLKRLCYLNVFSNESELRAYYTNVIKFLYKLSSCMSSNTSVFPGNLKSKSLSIPEDVLISRIDSYVLHELNFSGLIDLSINLINELNYYISKNNYLLYKNYIIILKEIFCILQLKVFVDLLNELLDAIEPKSINVEN